MEADKDQKISEDELDRLVKELGGDIHEALRFVSSTGHVTDTEALLNRMKLPASERNQIMADALSEAARRDEMWASEIERGRNPWHVDAAGLRAGAQNKLQQAARLLETASASEVSPAVSTPPSPAPGVK